MVVDHIFSFDTFSCTANMISQHTDTSLSSAGQERYRAITSAYAAPPFLIYARESMTYQSFIDTTAAQSVPCLCTILRSNKHTRTSLGGWRNCGTMQTLTSWSCLSGTRVIWSIYELYLRKKPNTSRVSIIRQIVLLWLSDEGHTSAENGLSFIETSALEAKNVEDAFQSILTGTQVQSWEWDIF